MRVDSDEKIEMEATTEFANAIDVIMFKTTESLIKLNQETNTINLIAGDKVSRTPKELETAYSDSMNQSEEMMKEYSTMSLTEKSIF